MIQTASGALAMKSKSLLIYFGISAPVIALIPEHVQILGPLIGLMCIDTVLGWFIAWKMKEFQSRLAQDRGARKAVLVIILGALWLASQQEGLEPLSKLADTLFLTFTLAEIISIVRHGYTIYAREKLPEVDVIRIVLQNAFSILKRMVESASKGVPSDK